MGSGNKVQKQKEAVGGSAREGQGNAWRGRRGQKERRGCAPKRESTCCFLNFIFQLQFTLQCYLVLVSGVQQSGFLICFLIFIPSPGPSAHSGYLWGLF